MSINYIYNEWSAKYGHEFVSHATKNGSTILEENRLMCAEHVLREKGSVEHEHAMARRRADASQFLTMPGNAWQYLAYNDRSDVTHFIVPDFALESRFLEHLKGWPEYDIEDKGEYLKVAITTGIQWKSSYESDFHNFLCAEDPTTLKGMSTYSINQPLQSRSPVFLDEHLRAKKIDATLRKIYAGCLLEHLCPDRLAYTLFEMRNRILNTDQHRLASDIRVEKNGVRWMYGDIAVLIGDPKPQLAWKIGFDDPRTVHREFHLLEPFQVQDGFYELKLDQEAVLILTTREMTQTIRENRHIPEAVKNRCVDFNLLTEDQKKHLS